MRTKCGICGAVRAIEVVEGDTLRQTVYAVPSKGCCDECENWFSDMGEMAEEAGGRIQDAWSDDG